MNASKRSHFIGFALALLLTILPFSAVAHGWLQRQPTVAAIGALAVLQIVVHLYYFLHLNPRSAPATVFLALIFALIIIDLMVGGSIWIMYDLHRRATM